MRELYNLDMSNHDPNYVHKPSYFVVGAKAVLTNPQGKILVIKRSTEGKSKIHNKWSLPGGGLEENENPNEAILREIEEELGLKEVLAIKLFTLNFHPDNIKPLLVLGYSGAVPEGQKITLNWEHSEHKFLTKEEALKLDLTEDGRFFIENLKI